MSPLPFPAPSGEDPLGPLGVVPQSGGPVFRVVMPCIDVMEDLPERSSDGIERPTWATRTVASMASDHLVPVRGDFIMVRGFVLPVLVVCRIAGTVGYNCIVSPVLERCPVTLQRLVEHGWEPTMIMEDLLFDAVYDVSKAP